MSTSAATPRTPPPCEHCDDYGEIHDDDGPHGWWHCSCLAGKAKKIAYPHSRSWDHKPVTMRMQTVLGMDVTGAFVKDQRACAIDTPDGCRHSADWCLIKSLEVVVSS